MSKGIKLVNMPHLDKDVHGIEGSLHISDQLFDLRQDRIKCGEIEDITREDMDDRPWRPPQQAY